MKTTKRLLVLLGIVLVLCIALFAFPIVGGLLLTQPVAAAGDSFMAALRDSDFDAAYVLMTPELQSELESAQGLQNFIVANGVQPASWSFLSRSVNNDEGQLEGTLTTTANVELNVRLVLYNVGGQWKIAGMHFT
jgi:hypothetical protein